MFKNNSDRKSLLPKKQLFHAANDENKFARLKIYLFMILDIIFSFITKLHFNLRMWFIYSY